MVKDTRQALKRRRILRQVEQPCEVLYQSVVRRQGSYSLLASQRGKIVDEKSGIHGQGRIHFGAAARCTCLGQT
ncbi:MAG: hypothetical protein ACK55Z_05795, partial [bacterium]